MKNGQSVGVRRSGAGFLVAASGFYRVPACGIRVLAARPLRVRENWLTELFGDYDPTTKLIRVWMRTAVRKVRKVVVRSCGNVQTRCVLSSSNVSEPRSVKP